MLDNMDKTNLTLVIMKNPPKTPAESIRLSQGAKIRKFREMKQLSQQALANQVGVSKAAVSEWERGRTSPRQHHQKLIAQSLSAPWVVLFGIEDAA